MSDDIQFMNTAPRDGTVIIVHTSYGIWVYGKYYEGKWREWDHFDGKLRGVIHPSIWLPYIKGDLSNLVRFQQQHPLYA